MRDVCEGAGAVVGVPEACTACLSEVEAGGCLVGVGARGCSSGVEAGGCLDGVGARGCLSGVEAGGCLDGVGARGCCSEVEGVSLSEVEGRG